MLDSAAPPEGVRKKPPLGRAAKLAAGIGFAAGLGLGATALASAATTTTQPPTTAPPPTTQPPTTQPPTTQAPSANTAPAPSPGPGFAFGHRRGLGFGGFGPSIRGEFVVPTPGGGYETLDIQVGQVMAVSPSSITIKSADGVSKTYVVDTGTVVTAGRDGIASVAQNETVSVIAVVTNGTAKAVDIRDVTAVTNHGKSWMPQRPANLPANGAAPSSPSG